MVKEFKENQRDCYDFDFFKSHFPNIEDKIITAALCRLSSDSLVAVKFYNNKPQIIFLDVQGIQEIEENSLWKKGYKVIKEIKELLR